MNDLTHDYHTLHAMTLEQKIHQVRLAAAHNQFSCVMAGVLAEICEIALKSEAKPDNVKEVLGALIAWLPELGQDNQKTLLNKLHS